jgi:putative sigma-54 modulation protein
MKVSLTFRNTEGENWQREYINEKLEKIRKYIDSPIEVHMVLTVEKFRNLAEINITSNGLNINGKEEAKDMHLAIDNAIEKIEKQLKKRKEKIREHKGNNLRDRVLADLEQGSEDIGETYISKVVETRKIILSHMSLDEAVMEMESSRNRFMIYRDSSTENVNLIYRSDDGNYSLIETNS